MALFLVIGPPASGKSTLIRALGGVEVRAPFDLERVRELARDFNLYVAVHTAEQAAPLRPYVAAEYEIRLPWNIPTHKIEVR